MRVILEARHWEKIQAAYVIHRKHYQTVFLQTNKTVTQLKKTREKTYQGTYKAIPKVDKTK